MSKNDTSDTCTLLYPLALTISTDTCEWVWWVCLLKLVDMNKSLDLYDMFWIDYHLLGLDFKHLLEVRAKFDYTETCNIYPIS